MSGRTMNNAMNVSRKSLYFQYIHHSHYTHVTDDDHNIVFPKKCSMNDNAHILTLYVRCVLPNTSFIQFVTNAQSLMLHHRHVMCIHRQFRMHV